jgi:hypothetical protein
VAPVLSVAVIVRVHAPAVVHVPLTTPLDDSVMPGGNVPALTLNVYGAVPPLAVNEILRGSPTWLVLPLEPAGESVIARAPMAAANGATNRTAVRIWVSE